MVLVAMVTVVVQTIFGSDNRSPRWFEERVGNGRAPTESQFSESTCAMGHSVTGNPLTQVTQLALGKFGQGEGGGGCQADGKCSLRVCRPSGAGQQSPILICIILCLKTANLFPSSLFPDADRSEP